MNAAEVDRARKLVAMLERAGENHGVLVVQGNVVIRDGVQCEDAPAMFEPADLQNAIVLGLLRENQVSGSGEWRWYVLRKDKVYSTIVWSKAAPDRKYTLFTVAESKDKATLKAVEAIRLHPLPNLRESEMEYKTGDASRPLKPGESFLNYVINNPDGSELARG